MEYGVITGEPISSLWLSSPRAAPGTRCARRNAQQSYLYAFLSVRHCARRLGSHALRAKNARRQHKTEPIHPSITLIVTGRMKRERKVRSEWPRNSCGLSTKCAAAMRPPCGTWTGHSRDDNITCRPGRPMHPESANYKFAIPAICSTLLPFRDVWHCCRRLGMCVDCERCVFTFYKLRIAAFGTVILKEGKVSARRWFRLALGICVEIVESLDDQMVPLCADTI